MNRPFQPVPNPHIGQTTGRREIIDELARRKQALAAGPRTQSELARVLGMSTSTISHLLGGRATLTVEFVEQVRGVLGLDDGSSSAFEPTFGAGSIGFYGAHGRGWVISWGEDGEVEAMCDGQPKALGRALRAWTDAATQPEAKPSPPR